jgi:hypothetical protein
MRVLPIVLVAASGLSTAADATTLDPLTRYYHHYEYTPGAFTVVAQERWDDEENSYESNRPIDYSFIDPYPNTPWINFGFYLFTAEPTSLNGSIFRPTGYRYSDHNFPTDERSKIGDGDPFWFLWAGWGGWPLDLSWYDGFIEFDDDLNIIAWDLFFYIDDRSGYPKRIA